MTHDRNDPAFPIPDIHVPAEFPGLTKREYFAGVALQGIIANPGLAGNASDYAKSALNYADALLEALND